MPPLPKKKFECVICDEEVTGLEEAKEHAMAQHKDDIVDEEWGHYFKDN